MFEWFKNKVIGGDTGKRESAWFLFLIWLSAAVVVSVLDAMGVKALFAKEMVRYAAPAVFTWLAAAHGMDWATVQWKGRGRING
ncbi:hypothetical protein RA27_02370 [Ruegeria sp. ANG-R]|uniref:hypothetical protein n=1 Tax=Ruegeria sp. ANG-R TaxID=1577903 RepID=UPI00057C3AEA|nr:hypothetical protein [Ruegeria sp. ANG-R]KIC42250.1 hypothetical protein RA27_02370 [Ruegeria sp. ANG-R]